MNLLCTLLDRSLLCIHWSWACWKSFYTRSLNNYKVTLTSFWFLIHALHAFLSPPPHFDWLLRGSTPASLSRSAFLINEAYLNNVQALGLEPISCQGTMINRNALLIIIITLTCAFLLEGLISADLENFLRRRSKACYSLPQMVV